MQAHAIAGPWAAGERILVCVSEDPRSAGLVRYAKRLADRLHAPWTALCIETRRSLQLTEEQRDRLADTLRLAEALGGEAVTIPGVGRRIADDVIGFAHANNVTQIVIGKSTRSRWFEILHGSVVHDLVRRAGNISVHVIAGDELAGEPVPKKTVRTAERPEPFDPVPYLMALVIVAVGARRRRTDPAVVRHRECRSGVPDRGRRRRGALRAVAVAAGQRRSVAVLQFLLPAADLHLHDHRSDQRRGVRLLHADRGPGLQCRGAGAHPGRSPRSAGRARPNRSTPSAASSPGTATLDDVLWATAYQIALMLKVRVVLLLPEDGVLDGQGRLSAGGLLDEADLAAANWAWATTARPGAAPTRCRAPSGCSCRCAPAAARSASSASTTTRPGRC